MDYKAPVINQVHNHIGTSIVLSLNNGKYPIPAGKVTELDFDIASVARTKERMCVFSAIIMGYMDVDVLVFNGTEYVKTGSYKDVLPKQVVTPPKKVETKPETKTTVTNTRVTSEERAESLGIKVETIEHKEKAVNVIEEPKQEPVKATEPKEDTVKPYVKPAVVEEHVVSTPADKGVKETAVKKDTALKSVKNNSKKGQ